MQPMDSRVEIGHVRLTVADLDRALAFYAGSLGFDVVAMLHIKARPHRIDSCARALAEYSFVRFVTITFGATDIIARSELTGPARPLGVRNDRGDTRALDDERMVIEKPLAVKNPRA